MDDRTESRLSREVELGLDEYGEDDLEVVQDPAGLEKRVVAIGLLVAVFLGMAIPIAVNANDISRVPSSAAVAALPPAGVLAAPERPGRDDVAPSAGEVLDTHPVEQAVDEPDRSSSDVHESVLGADELVVEESLLASDDTVVDEAPVAGGNLVAEDALVALDVPDGAAALEADEALLAAHDADETAEPALVVDEDGEPTDLAADVESDS